MRISSALTLALLLIGCSSGPSTRTSTSGTGTSGSGITSSSATSTGSGSTGSGSGSSSGTTGCNTDQFSCVLTDPCGIANYVDSTTSTSGGAHFADAAPARCILEHLRDGATSQLTVAENYGQSVSTVQTIRVLDATHASRDTLINQDVTSYRTDSPSLLIKPPSFFDDCLDGGTDDTLWSCLNNWSDGTDNAALCCP